MATPTITPQAATAWDEQGNPVQPQQPTSTGATAWDETGTPIQPKQPSIIDKAWEVGQTAYHDVGAAAKSVGDLVDHIIGYKASDHAKDELTRGWSALKSGEISEAQVHLRNASEDIVENHPVSQLLKQQWDSSARNQAAVEEDMKRGDHLATVQHAAGIMPIANVVSDAFDKAIKEPTAANVTHAAVTGAMALSPSIVKRVAAAGEMAEGAVEVAPASKPGIVKQVVQGEKVAQPAAQAALSEAAGSEATSLRESLTDPIATTESNAKALYKQIDDASGADFKALGKKLQSTNRALRQTVDDAEEARLTERRDNIEQTIADAKQKAVEAGVDPKVLDQADAEFKKMSALTDVETKVFKNVKVVKGNAAKGTAETVDIDRAVEELQKLQDNEKYGAPRLEQAFGKQGASELLNKFYEAQRQGVHAMKMQQIAKWVARAAGAALLYEGARTIVSGNQ